MTEDIPNAVIGHLLAVIVMGVSPFTPLVYDLVVY